jgi:hypothetical protein
VVFIIVDVSGESGLKFESLHSQFLPVVDCFGGIKETHVYESLAVRECLPPTLVLIRSRLGSKLERSIFIPATGGRVLRRLN